MLYRLLDLPRYLLPVVVPFVSLTLDFSQFIWSQLDKLHAVKILPLQRFCTVSFFFVVNMANCSITYMFIQHNDPSVLISAVDYTQFFFQFQKHGRDVEKVKQRLAEIANYVDKVKHTLPFAQDK